MIFCCAYEHNDWTPSSLYYGLYRFLSRLFFTLVFPCFCLYVVLTGKHRIGLGQRLGLYKNSGPRETSARRIWLHAASVGEVQVAKSLIRQIKKQLPEAAIYLSTVTAQGQKVAREQIGRDARCFFAPLDLPGAVERALNWVDPEIYICLETELWPTLLAAADKRGVKIFLLNARLSEKSFGRYLRIKCFIKRVLAHCTCICTILPSDAERYAALGAEADKITVQGNAKYESACAHMEKNAAGHYRNLLGIADNTKVFISGSTHANEEEMLIETWTILWENIGDLIWLVAPRHLERVPEIAGVFSEKGLQYDLFSHLEQNNARRSNIIIIDVMGKLAALYSIGTFIFCGGSLVNRGGHNLMEAAAWNKPVFYGPHMADFMDAKEILESVGAGFAISSPALLAQGFLEVSRTEDNYLALGQKAGEIACAQQGSAGRQIELITNYLQ